MQLFQKGLLGIELRREMQHLPNLLAQDGFNSSDLLTREGVGKIQQEHGRYIQSAIRNRKSKILNHPRLSYPNGRMMSRPAIKGELRQRLQHTVCAFPAGRPIAALALGQQGQADRAGETGRRAARPFGEDPAIGVDGGQFADLDTSRGELGPGGMDLHRFGRGCVPALPEAALDERRDGQRRIRALRAEGGGTGKFQPHLPRAAIHSLRLG